jgi:hypothetical protein
MSVADHAGQPPAGRPGTQAEARRRSRLHSGPPRGQSPAAAGAGLPVPPRPLAADRLQAGKGLVTSARPEPVLLATGSTTVPSASTSRYGS